MGNPIVKNDCIGIEIGKRLEKDLIQHKNIHIREFVGSPLDLVTQFSGYRKIILVDAMMPGLGGLALQQAMMCAKPVVCSVADGTELDLVKDGRNGFFLPREEPIEAWTQRISRVLTDPDLRERMGRQSGEIIEGEFNSDIMIQRILDAIEYSVTNAG